MKKAFFLLTISIQFVFAQSTHETSFWVEGDKYYEKGVELYKK